MKIKSFYIASCAIFIIAFMSCSKDDNFQVSEDTSEASLKFGPPVLTSNVTDNYPTHFGKEAKVYKTIILGKQEWIMGYWENDCVDQEPTAESGVYKSPNYTTNAQYYEWAAILENTTQETWDTYVFDKPGFHIPTNEDMRTVYKYLGEDFTKFYEKLKLPAYSDHWVGDPFNKFLDSGNSIGGFWVRNDNDPNKVEGCGIVCRPSDSDNKKYAFAYTNISNLGVRVVLLRNIK